MEPWLIWTISGVILIVFELAVPGGITCFVGAAAVITGILIRSEFLVSTSSIALTFILLSILLLLFLRTVLMKYFEGKSQIQNVDEDKDAAGTIVEVTQEIRSYQEGRIRFRGTSWQARSDDEIMKDSKAVIVSRDGNTWIVKSI